MDEKGLTREEAEKRIREGKRNTVTFEHRKSEAEIITSHIFTLFNGINLLLAFLVFLTGEYKNMLFMGTVFFNTLIGIIQEIRAKRSLDKLRIRTVPMARVIRDGKEIPIKSEDIVLDDLVVIRSGDLLSFDGKVLEGHLDVNESLLTGEQDSVGKDTGDPVFGGSIVIAGSALVKAESVGNNAYSAKIIREVRKEKRQKSRLRDALDFIIKNVTIILFPLGILLFVTQHYLTRLSIRDSLLGTVAALVGMIPEGLVLLTSVALNIGAVLLVRENTLVKEMYSLETLARADVFAIDKTGTITTGKMDVAEVHSYTGKDVFDIIASIVSCSDDRNPTSLALEAFFPLREKIEAVRFEGFRSAVKKTVFETNDHLYELGAYPFLDCERDKHIEEDIERYSSRGLRVLCLSEDRKVISLILLKDEIRKSAEKTIDYILSEGVDLKIISGDDPKTVGALLRQIAYPFHDNAVDCSTVNDEELRQYALTKNVFGRCTPEQKDVIVTSLQEAGHTVGMMGDGINDILALRKADFSIALFSGAESVRDIANVVLVDDDFAHIPSIIAQGRRVINNIRRTATLFLSKTVMSVLLSVLVILFLKNYPYEPIQLTLVSTLCIGFPSFVLSFEPKYDRVPSTFLSDIFAKAIACGLSIVLGICALRFIESLGAMDTVQYETAATLLAGGSIIYLIYRISRPLTLLRGALLVIAVLGISLAYFLFPSFFSFAKLDQTAPLFFIGTLAFSILFHFLLEKSGILRKITGKIDEWY